MAFSKRIFHVSVMCSILVFALIHVGVSIGIIIPGRHYGDIFQPQIGLAAFNLVIFLVALITGVLGVFSVLKSARPVGKFFSNLEQYSLILIISFVL
jgi:succinate dehydrogenase hydrophobic anchor subunit